MIPIQHLKQAMQGNWRKHNHPLIVEFKIAGAIVAVYPNGDAITVYGNDNLEATDNDENVGVLMFVLSNDHDDVDILQAACITLKGSYWDGKRTITSDDLPPAK